MGAPPAGAQLPIFQPDEAPAPSSPPAATGQRYANPVIPGDYPDPSVIRDGGRYWLVTTSGGWRPPFTMLHSRDLVNWVVAGSVLRHRPRWATEHFWAPELVRRGRRFLVYYAAKSTRGRFCVAVASARSPAGFFTDHGPLVCSPEGSIDPLAVQDEKGVPHLIWKEDGNARGRATPIMAAPLTPDGLHITGTPRELFRADAPWERGVVERPWGVQYLMYHAHTESGSTDVGRQVLLDRLEWSADGWPVVNGGAGPSHEARTPGDVPQLPRPEPFSDHFGGRFLTAGWYWTAARPRMRMSRRDGGRLLLGTSRGRSIGVVGRQPGDATFVAETIVGRRRSGTDAGIAVYRDAREGIGIEVRGDYAVVWRRPDAARSGLAAVKIGSRQSVALRVRALGRRRFAFDVGTESGWDRVGDVYPPPPWGGEQRVVLRVAGHRRALAAFESFELGPAPGERR